mmetsp:Transcript_26253/g.40691  ORF Transcript_26253/g.40691 Transcript_26253/m.40691 type:complete len:202 (+) Transcript_26253:110-715(+)|eukprot:CAMPEP_0196811812 /NCGR_PEP_ID=MMETSP1362-20130617/20071_1 /TAXON_ID=163516 /ORGANISM="Leptocylindrus danicus, Strain CCMP1856" /LENGTH=201 /DNA_ID=CAMNT_0042187195 /DNA_START=91 /DNA_END=696 /DNA_ORIENTATION=-
MIFQSNNIEMIPADMNIPCELEALFEDGANSKPDSIGCVYTVGLTTTRNRPELFCTCKRSQVDDVANAMIFLCKNEKEFRPGQGYLKKKADGSLFRLYCFRTVVGEPPSPLLQMENENPSTIYVEILVDSCFLRQKCGMLLLSRRLPSGRIINVDTCDGSMLRPGGVGMAHLNMNQADNSLGNTKWLREGEARKLLMMFIE